MKGRNTGRVVGPITALRNLASFCRSGHYLVYQASPSPPSLAATCDHDCNHAQHQHKTLFCPWFTGFAAKPTKEGGGGGAARTPIEVTPGIKETDLDGSFV